jgi:hypothetical protein
VLVEVVSARWPDSFYRRSATGTPPATLAGGVGTG